MPDRRVRSFTSIAIAMILGALIASAAALSYSSFTTITKTSTEVTTSTYTVVSTVVSTREVTPTCSPGAMINSSGTESQSSTTNCTSWITLSINASTAVVLGQNQTISISLTNDLPLSRNITYTSTPAELSNLYVDYILPLPTGTCYEPPAGTDGIVPAFFTIYNSSDVPVLLSDDQIISACNQPIGPFYDYDAFNASQTQTETFSIGGYWINYSTTVPWLGAQYNEFPPGDYTIVAFDSWGQIGELGFTVIGS
jgi:hypothetical protein